MKKLVSSRLGMSLVEVTIVILVLGVIAAAIFLTFVSGTEHFNFARRQNELDTEGRLILDRLTSEIIWAGYMPRGGWSNDEWHPVVLGENHKFEYYADFEPWGTLNQTDYKTVYLVGSSVMISDSAGTTETLGQHVTGMDLEYLDEDGNILPAPLSPTDRDLTRHIRVALQLSQEWGGDVYQTNLHTTISPRNLGVNHNINPAFYPPKPLVGNVVVNIGGTELNPMPTADEQEMVDRLQFWGLTVTQLTDDALEGHDYSNTSLLILRHMGGSLSHADPAFYQSLPVPIVTLSAMDAYVLFGMGTGQDEKSSLTVTPFREDYINDDLTTGDPVQVYNTSSTGYQSVLKDVDTVSTANPLLLTIVDDETECAICVMNRESENMRRFHYSLWNASAYNEEEGWPYFYRLIFYASNQGGEEDIGTPLGEFEGFEGPGIISREVSLWEENVNNPSMMVDSVQLYYEPFNASPALTWTYRPLGGGEVLVNSGVLQMDRATAGAATRNIASVSVDLSGYSYLTDELALTVRCRSYEGAFDSRDGVFFGHADTLFHANFEGSTSLPAGVTESVPSHGRRVIQSPAGWGGDGNFITYDRRNSGAAVSNRMAMTFGTGGHPAGTTLTVGYRFHDHHDDNDSGTTGDFVGWGTGGVSGAVSNASDLRPDLYANNTWYGRYYTFAPSPMPANLSVIFGSCNNNQASAFDNNDGLSFDNLVVTADTTYTRIGAGTGVAGWETIRVDLDDAAFAAGYPFGHNYQISLSQYGTDPVPTGGIQWDDFRITRLQNILSIPGWSHAPMGVGRPDSWNPKVILPIMGYSWTTQQSSGGSYADNTYCYLTTPTIALPAGLASPALQFTHSFGTEVGYDGGFVQISVDGGAWQTLTAASGLNYNVTSYLGFPAGAGIAIFSGTRGWQTETVNLTPYSGHTVAFRFVFGADASGTGAGWHLDNFRVFGIEQGYEVTDVQFEANSVPLPWDYSIDAYMSATTASSFAGAGELDKNTMSHVVTAGTLTAAAPGWVTLHLDNSYLLPPGESLLLKVEQHDATSGMTADWTSQDTGISNTCRQAASDASDPVVLNIINRRPSIRLMSNADMLSEVTGTIPTTLVPLNNGNLYNDFEAIYLPTELGTEGTGNWTHGGTNDDWQIGTPMFLMVDPPLTAANGVSVAGNDLNIDDGLYDSNEWAYFISPAYPMPDVATYDSITVRYYRCLRLSALDAGYTYVGFSDNTTPPTPMSSDWHLLRTYEGDDMISWDYENVKAIPEFQDAYSAGHTYYFLRFILFSGPFAERGGWNLDNIQIYGK